MQILVSLFLIPLWQVWDNEWYTCSASITKWNELAHPSIANTHVAAHKAGVVSLSDSDNIHCALSEQTLEQVLHLLLVIFLV